jgi:ribonuclease VapC
MAFGGMKATEAFLETSALVAIIKDEEEREEFLGRLRMRPHNSSDMVRVEAAFVLAKMFGGATSALIEVDAFLEAFRIRILLADGEVIRRCAVARDVYGKGSGHRAKLNLGDCFSYAFAARYGLDLLYKGDDFALTDLG